MEKVLDLKTKLGHLKVRHEIIPWNGDTTKLLKHVSLEDEVGVTGIYDQCADLLITLAKAAVKGEGVDITGRKINHLLYEISTFASERPRISDYFLLENGPNGRRVSLKLA